MQYMATAVKRTRLAILGLALLLSIGFGSVVAASSDAGLTECDQPGCALAHPAPKAFYQMVSASPWYGSFVSEGPLDMGFTP